jgi:hypothetical protein
MHVPGRRLVHEPHCISRLFHTQHATYDLRWACRNMQHGATHILSCRISMEANDRVDIGVSAGVKGKPNLR